MQGNAAGYQFQVPVAGQNLVQPGMGILQKLLVCRGVTLEVTYPNGDAPRLAASAPTGAGTRAKLVGNMHVGASTKRAAVAQVTSDAKTGVPRLVLNVGANGPSDTPGPLAQVIGARINHPYPSAAPALRRRGRGRLHAAPSHAAALATKHKALASGAALVTQYERSFGTITAAQMQSAGVGSALAYVLQHVLGAIWSGAATKGTPPVTVSAMRAARTLRHLFPQMPMDGSDVLTELHAYLAATDGNCSGC
mgnify:CR=1 FL=1